MYATNIIQSLGRFAIRTVERLLVARASVPLLTVAVLICCSVPTSVSASWVSPTSHVNGTGWTNGNLARDGNTVTYASHGPAANWGGWQTFSYTDSLWSDRFRVYTDFGYGEVDSVQVEVSLDNVIWNTVHTGAVLDAAWDTKLYTAQYVRHARFRYHRVTTTYTFWLYELQLFEAAASIDTATVTTTAATSTERNSAVVHGRLDEDGGEPCELRFQYGLTTAYEIDTTAWVPGYVDGNTAGVMFSGLAPSTTYHYRVQARNSAATADGADGTFTTADPLAPGWVSPTSSSDGTGRWVSNANIYDDETASFASCFHTTADPGGVWSPYIYLNHDSIHVDSIRFYAKDDINISRAQIDVSSDSVTWQSVYDAPFANKTWIPAPVARQWVTQSRARFRVASNGVGLYWEFHEFDLHQTGRPALAVIDSQWVTEGDTLALGVSAIDLDGDSLILSAINLPANASFIDSTNGAGSMTFAPDLTQAGVYSVTFVASDTVFSDSQVVVITVVNQNQPPVLALIDSQWVAEGDTLTFGASASDFDGDSLILSGAGLPANASLFDSTNGTGSVTFLPDYSQAGVHNITVIASDGALADSQVVTVTVSHVNVPPVLTVIDSQWVAEGDTLALGVSASDFDGDSLVLSADSLPANATFTDSTNGASSLIFTPDFTQAGVYGIPVIVSDTALADSQVVWVTVTQTNLPPVLTAIDSQWVAEGDTLTFDASASDFDGNGLVLSATGLPANATFMDSTNGAGSLTFIPDFTQAGVYGITVVASDTALADSQVVWVTVADVNRPPMLWAIDTQWIDEGATLTFGVNATDPDGDSLVLSATDLPANATFLDSTNGGGSVTFTPDFTQAGSYTLSFDVGDGALTHSMVMIVIVTNLNQPPVLAVIDTQWVAEGDTLTFHVNGTDPDGDSLVLSATNVPVNASFVDSTNGAGSMTFAPDYSQAGGYHVAFTVSDSVSVDSQTVVLIVTDLNRRPVLAVVDSQWVAEGDTLLFDVHGTDPDADSLILSATNIPVNATFIDSSGGAGSFEFLPDLMQAGVYDITLIVSDGAVSDSLTVVITVTNVNQPPVVAIVDSQWVTEGDTLTFGVSATDFDGDSMTLTAIDLPTNATFVDSGNGMGGFTFLPDYDQNGAYSILVVSTDASLSDTVTVTITVANQNRSPVLSAPGPQTVDEGGSLTFAVTATDQDGDSLILAAANLPAGAAFVDSGNGTARVTFLPGYEQAGVYVVDFMATDGAAGDSAGVTITVAETNRAPAITAPDSQQVNEGELLSFVVTATDSDADELTLFAETIPANATFTDLGDGTGRLDFTPDYAQSGDYLVRFLASDGLLADTSITAIHVLPTNRAPKMNATSSQFVVEGETLAFTVTGTDPDGDPLEITASNLPASASFADNGNGSGGFTFAPGYSDAGTYVVAFHLTDGERGDSASVFIEVAEQNRPPVFISVADTTVSEGDTLELNIEALDPDGHDLALAAFVVPPGATFTDLGGGRGSLLFRPDFEQAGSIDVVLTANDGALSDTLRFQVLVANANRPPRFAESGTPADPETREGSPLVLDIYASDPDGAIPSIRAIDLPENAAFVDEGDGSGRFVFVPDYEQAGEHVVQWVATDGVLSDSMTLTLKVFESNRAPLFAAVDSQVVAEGATLEMRIEARDPDGGIPSIAADSLVENAAFVDSGNGFGLLTFTPTYVQAGSYEIVFVASDLETEESLTVKIVVTETDLPGTFKLLGNQPNPFNATTTFSFVLGVVNGGEPIPVSLMIYNIRGARVTTLVRESLPPGPHAFVWDGLDQTGRPVVSGMYLFVLEAAGRMESRKAVLVR